MRQPYEITRSGLEKLFAKRINLDDKKEVEEHCNLIQEFLDACGWTSEEYIVEMFGFNKEN